MFGQRRERYEDPRQQSLFESVMLDAEQSPPESDSDAETSADDDAAEDDADDSSGESTGGKRGRRRRVIPDCLPRRRVERELNDQDIPDHLRGQPARKFFKKAGEWIEFEPATLYVVEEFVEVLACDNQDATETAMIEAKKPERILDCFAGPALLAYLSVQRFADHLPYYREEEILARYGVTIGRHTLCRWMVRLGRELLPLVDRMRSLALQSSVVQADETPVKMLDPELSHARTVYLWAVLGDRRHPYTTFYFTPDRSRAGPQEFFSGFDGYLVSDAYTCYSSVAKASGGEIRLAGCHAHARRKFEELHDLGPTQRTATALGFFQRLYDIEDRVRDATDAERHRVRQAESALVLGEFKSWLDAQLETLRPKHELRGAISYMTSRWENFSRFLESGAIPFDNNASERAVKVAVMGKKNWLFFGSPSGGEAAAIFYTLTATCRDLKIDPLAYLTDVFRRLPQLIPSELDSLLPDRWITDRPQHRLTERVRASERNAARKRQRRAQRRRAIQAADKIAWAGNGLICNAYAHIETLYHYN